MIDQEYIHKLMLEQKDAAGDIKSISGEINMIAINAAIESAHAAAGIRTMMDQVLNNMLIALCRMLTSLLEAKSLPLDSAGLDQFTKYIGIDEIYITDADGVTVASNKDGAKGWRFPDDPKAQAFIFRSLIGQKDGVVTQPIKERDIDSLMFKFVGVSRTDEPGIVQIGLQADNIARYQTEVGTVFGLLATEIRNLGQKVDTSTKRIAKVSYDLDKCVDDTSRL